MAELEASQQVAGVGVAHIERIFELLREKLPRVLEANRYFEEQTGLHNEAGMNNIVDAFSHLATLVENANELDDVAQGEQVAHLEDHLRRSMMEAFEQVVKLRLADVADAWEEYSKVAKPLQARGRLGEVASPQSLEDARRELKFLLEQGRASKRAVSWEAWQEGTDYFARACEVSERLLQDLKDATAAAHLLRRNVLLALGGTAIGLIAGVGGARIVR